MRKYLGLCAVLALLFACTGSRPPSGKDGGDDGDNGDDDKNTKVFSVALASDVKDKTVKILEATTKTDGSEVVGLAVNKSAAMAGVPFDSWVAAPTELEVWFTDATYVKDDGDPADQAASQPYVIAWDAYDATDASTSVQGSYAAGRVTISPATTAKPARRKVQVGADLLNKLGGVVVVVMLYKNGSDPDSASLQHQPGGAEGLLARYKLTITKAPLLDVTGISVSAHGFAKATAPTQDEIDKAPIAAKAVTPDAVRADRGTTSLPLTVLATNATTRVGYNNFEMSGGNLPTLTWKLSGFGASSTTGGIKIAETKVAAKGNTAGKSVTRLPLTPTVRADFVAATDSTGGVALLGSGDKYGREVQIVVFLYHGYS